MKKFNFTKLPDKVHKSFTQRDVQIRSAKEGEFLNRDDITYLISQFEHNHPNAKFRAVGLGITGNRELLDSTQVITTFKKYDSSFHWADEEEYLAGRVKKDTKFANYFQFTISMIIDKPSNIFYFK